MHALFITFRSAVAPAELEEDFTRYAEALRDGAARGLVGKTWLSDGPTVGGFCLFEDRGLADRYLDGMFAGAVTANPVFSDVRVERYDVDGALSRITNGLGALAVGGRRTRTSKRRERRRVMHENVGKAVLGLGLGLVVLLGTLTTRAGVIAQDESPMTAAETRATMEAYAAALLGGGAYEAYFANDIVVTMTGVPGEITGPAAAKAAIDAIHHEQFDAKPELTTLVVGEGTAAAELMFVGTHTGEFAGIAATGKEVSVPYSVFYELADGKITALRIYALAEGLVQQLQAAPSMSTGAPRSGTLHLTKECSEYTGEAGSFCTIVSSNFEAIPTGSKIVYAEAVTAAGDVDSDLVVNTPNGDAAYGHVVLDGATQTGTVTLAGGTGQLANLAADLVVAPLAEPNYSWDGPYSY
jgi:predicted ester cyclase